jgi:23S rRNA pseudouridine2605 synthase
MEDRLQKILAAAGVASRRHAETLIAEGHVQVNGRIVTEPGSKADQSKDFIKVDGKRIPPLERKVYLLLNKPKGYITSRRDPEGRPTVMDLVGDVKERVSPVGRLDFETEGLLLLSNDGELANGLMHPKNGVEKTYWTKVKGRFKEKDLKRIARGGIPLPSGKTAPCKVRSLRHTESKEWIELILHEGKKREVRLMMLRVGHPVIKLKRVAYAFLKVGDLPLGSYRHLTKNEVKKLREIVSKGPRPYEASDKIKIQKREPLPRK